MTTGILSTANLHGVAQPSGQAASIKPEVKAGETLFHCALNGMRIVMPDGTSKFFVNHHMVISDPVELKFMRTIPTVTEVKSEKPVPVVPAAPVK